MSPTRSLIPHPFLNFQVDHMTLLVDPEMYNAAYVVFRTVFGVSKENILYEKRKEWVKGEGEASMTFAVRIGQPEPAQNHPSEIESLKSKIENTVIAVVQPSEPPSQRSHVRETLQAHAAAVHWQHVALRTADLLAFHKHALEHGVNFITPILKDSDEDLIQVFSGEWYLPGGKPSGVFFEFVQRNPTPALLKKLEQHNRESWFRDKTFLGLYSEKEKEYQSGKVASFLDHDLFSQIQSRLKSKRLWEIAEEDIASCRQLMREYARKKSAVSNV